MSWALGLIAAVFGLAACGSIAGCRRGGVLLRIRHAAAALIWLAIALLSSALLVVTRAFESFSSETLVARITAQQLGPEEFNLRYEPASGGGPAQDFRLRGDQWTVSGGIIKWHPWLTAAGVTSYHKPLRVSGQYNSLKKQQEELPTVFALGEETDVLWEAVYRVSPWLPFLDAVYGSSAYAYLEPGVVQEVYVTPSGYLIKRR